MYRGQSMVESEPKGILLAATLVPKEELVSRASVYGRREIPKMVKHHAKEARNTAKRVDPLQYLSKIAPSSSQGFQSCSPRSPCQQLHFSDRFSPTPSIVDGGCGQNAERCREGHGNRVGE